MASAVLSPFLYSDYAHVVSASGVITKGDWCIYSGSVVIAADDETLTSPCYRYSAAGVALGHNPKYDVLGAAYQDSAFVVAHHGVFRFSASLSGTAGDIPLGSFAYPEASASGIVGQTGATGLGPTWATAPPAVLSTAAGGTGKFAATPLGVGVVVGHPLGGDSGVGQVDILVNLATNIA